MRSLKKVHRSGTTGRINPPAIRSEISYTTTELDCLRGLHCNQHNRRTRIRAMSPQHNRHARITLVRVRNMVYPALEALLEEQRGLLQRHSSFNLACSTSIFLHRYCILRWTHHT